MAPRITFLSDILPGKIDWKIRVRVIRLWKVPDFKNPLQLNSVEMILLDEQTAKIQASIKRSLLPRFEALVEEGSTYIIENLLVAQNDPKYKTTRHKYKLNFMGSTKCTKTDAEKIPPNYFEFVGFPQILGGIDNGFLIDVIGYVVVKEDIKETEKNGVKSRLIDITLEDLESNRIICTLWGDFADEMYQYLDKDDSSAPVVIILQLCKMKTFNGKMGISNAYNGTKLLINPNLTEASEYKQKLENGNISITPVVSHMSEHTTISLGDDLLQTQRMTISDLIEASEKCFCTVLAEVIKVDADKGWAYESCNKCLTKVTIVGTKYYCEKCENMVVAVPRYKLQVKVMDKTGSTTFILFDRILTQYLGKSAKDLIELMDKGDVSANCPAEFDSLMDRPLLFKVENTKTNIELNWQSYIVKKMSNDKELIQQFKTLYSIQDDEDAEDTLNNVVSPQIDDNMKVVIGDDSERNVQMSQVEFNRNDGLTDDDEITPSSKGIGKRSADSVQKTLDFEDSGTQASGTKLAKIVAVKKEPID